MQSITTPLELATKINTCSNNFLSCIPDYHNVSKETTELICFTSNETRIEKVEEYAREISFLMEAYTGEQLSPKLLYDKKIDNNKDNAGVIMYFHLKEEEYKSKKNREYRDSQRQAKYIKGLRTTLYQLLQNPEPVTSPEVGVTRKKGKVNTNKRKTREYAKKTELPIVSLSTNNIVVADTRMPDVNDNSQPTSLEVIDNILPTPQIDELEQVRIKDVFKKLTSLQLAEIKSWSTVSTIDTIDVIKKQYSTAQNELLDLINQLDLYITSTEKEEREEKVGACSIYLNKVPFTFKAEQQQGNIVYKNLAFVKRKLTALGERLLEAPISE